MNRRTRIQLIVLLLMPMLYCGASANRIIGALGTGVGKRDGMRFDREE
jgi:hypothetical protein